MPGLPTICLATGICKALANLILHPSVEAQTHALRIGTTIVRGRHVPGLARAIIDAGALGALAELLLSPVPRAREDALAVIANVAAGTPQQTGTVIDTADVLPRLLAAMSTPELRRMGAPAVLAIARSTRSLSRAQKHLVAEAGILPVLCTLLDASWNAMSETADVMVSIESLLEAGQTEMRARGLRENPYAMMVVDCGGASALRAMWLPSRAADGGDSVRVVRILRMLSGHLLASADEAVSSGGGNNEDSGGELV